MNTNLNRPGEYNRLLETAKKRAAELRSEAVNNFWDGAGDAAQRAMRAAARLAVSLARHQRARPSVEA
ncbi:MAG: hypothetical protein H7255_09530 [Ramlibacter sp.]|nr:hypothetical protein [Ramlibacter sp.]